MAGFRNTPSVGLACWGSLGRVGFACLVLVVEAESRGLAGSESSVVSWGLAGLSVPARRAAA